MRRSFALVGLLLAPVLGAAALEGTGQLAPESDFAVLFYSGRGGNDDIYTLRPGQREPLNLTRHAARDQCPTASPDGKRIAFLSDRGGTFDIYSMAIDGSDVRSLTTSPEREEHPEFSPDGRTIVFVRDFEERAEVWIMNADGSGQRRLTSGGWRDERPFVSPDGSRILFMSNRDGNFEVYQVNADGSHPLRLTNDPAWGGWASFVRLPKPTGPTPAAIIEKHLAAIGGRDALRAVKTMVVRGRNAGLGGSDRPLVRYLKRPNLLRQQEAPASTAFIVSDGARVFQVGASGRVEVTQPWAAPLRHTTIDDGFLEDGKAGVRYEYLGTDGIKTGPWQFHRVRRVFPDGYAEDLYFEADSGLLRMRVEDNGRAKRVFYDYRDVGGIRYPFVTATVFDALEPPHLFIVDEVTLNVAIDDGFFAPSAP